MRGLEPQHALVLLKHIPGADVKPWSGSPLSPSEPLDFPPFEPACQHFHKGGCETYAEQRKKYVAKRDGETPKTCNRVRKPQYETKQGRHEHRNNDEK